MQDAQGPGTETPNVLVGVVQRSDEGGLNGAIGDAELSERPGRVPSHIGSFIVEALDEIRDSGGPVLPPREGLDGPLANQRVVIG